MSQAIAMGETTPRDEDSTRTFVEVTEIWVPEGNRLVWWSGNYGALSEFAGVSTKKGFNKGEGLPGNAWAEEKPIVLKDFDGSYFKRTDAARAAGLTSAVAFPIFAGKTLKAVVVVLCADDAVRTGAIEVWHEENGLLMLDDGYYGAAKHFEWVSQHTHFPRGQGLPGGVWAAEAPMLMRDLGSGYRFIRAESAGKAGLTTGLGLPIATPNGRTYVMTLLSALGTPIARRFELWKVRSARTGGGKEAVLADGICERDGPLWDDETETCVPAWQGPIGEVVGSGIPIVKHDTAAPTAGYASMVAVPIYRADAIHHVVAWYS
ncbi:GAF domain-containing protein [Fulvimarina sp. 2208YS6-2-32]|uniref:GAF domain-containing protein n=1 Tax=Fulvimarina uroteuthidis TaxID=3098149 RepID=A0ABU5I0G8_9HYPH|nr:GAF domain-containing protein [Fulvimarina sp. 2208YS6-2-32]MDY8108815.1 GAF domain-containing protein [Fulvimarina sp. 2208YS6-2-32]